MYISDASSAKYAASHRTKVNNRKKNVNKEIRNISIQTMFTMSYRFRLPRRKK